MEFPSDRKPTSDGVSWYLWNQLLMLGLVIFLANVVLTQHYEIDRLERQLYQVDDLPGNDNRRFPLIRSLLFFLL